jgi:hypothetical protein
MPVDLQVIQANEFVCLDADEQLNFEASKEALQTLALACRKRGLDRALLDLRAVPIPDRPLFTPTQLAALVRTFHDAGFGREQRLAVLYRSDPHGGARTFAFIGRIQGWQVRAFEEFEAAFHWLSEETPGGAAHQENEITIPITKRPSEGKKLPVGEEVSGTSAERPARRTIKRHR